MSPRLRIALGSLVSCLGLCFTSPVSGALDPLDPLVAAPGTSRSIAAGLYNPAAWATRGPGGFFFSWDQPLDHAPAFSLADSANRTWSARQTAVLAARYAAFGVRRVGGKNSAPDHYDYTLGLSGGDGGGAYGLSYTWSRGGIARFGKRESLSLGTVHRSRSFSLGLDRDWELEDGEHSYQADLGIRPFGPRWTLFAEGSNRDDRRFRDLDYGFGVEAMPVNGVSAAVRYVDGESYASAQWSFRVGLSLSRGSETSYRYHIDEDGNPRAWSYAVESGAGPSLAARFASTPRIAELELRGPLAYRRFRLFDDRAQFLGTLARIAQYAEDPEVETVVVRLSSFEATPAALWELREQLDGLRESGKQVVLYFDRATFSQFTLVSVADQIWMDPSGMIDLRGLVLGRTYYRRMLDKMGIGFDEWRYFTYKSALESFSRTSMSPADREQLTAFVDDVYGLAASTICGARGIDEERWERLVNQSGFVLPKEALAAGLVDSLGGYEDAKKVAEKSVKDREPLASSRQSGFGDGRASSGAPDGRLDRAAHSISLTGDPNWRYDIWGRTPKIAVLYAIGVCAMDSGIRGRQLSAVIREAREDRTIDAIVLRVDSPGGDPLPSDLVSREIEETVKKKPVIVSQGQLAASGGYWISMHADTILATPVSVTGSIGVINGHAWDNGIGEKLGMDYENVKRGQAADLMSGPSLPFIGLGLPKRPASLEERMRAENIIRDLYSQFVGEVSRGRDLDPGRVDTIAQGRIWSGIDGVGNGLVDELGGLWEAIRIAKEAAGIPEDRPIDLVEGPSLGLFNAKMLSPFPIGIEAWEQGSEDANSGSGWSDRLGAFVGRVGDPASFVRDASALPASLMDAVGITSILGRGQATPRFEDGIASSSAQSNALAASAGGSADPLSSYDVPLLFGTGLDRLPPLERLYVGRALLNSGMPQLMMEPLGLEGAVFVME